MENQHQRIKGYRDLTQAEIDLMNEGKELAEKCGAYVEKLRRSSFPSNYPEGVVMNTQAEGRWVAVGATHLQQGFMALVRSIAKPMTF